VTATFTPGPTPNTVHAADGTVLTAPDGWALLHGRAESTLSLSLSRRK
jgi:hypothetical protein